MQIDRSLVQGFDLFEGMRPDEIDDMLAQATSRRYLDAFRLITGRDLGAA